MGAGGTFWKGPQNAVSTAGALFLVVYSYMHIAVHRPNAAGDVVRSAVRQRRAVAIACPRDFPKLRCHRLPTVRLTRRSNPNAGRTVASEMKR